MEAGKERLTRDSVQVRLLIQIIETINESRASREAAHNPQQPSLFDF